MNPYAVIIATVVGRQRKCPSCGEVQVITRPRDGHYACKKCGHRFTRKELLSPSKP